MATAAFRSLISSTVARRAGCRPLLSATRSASAGHLLVQPGASSALGVRMMHASSRVLAEVSTDVTGEDQPLDQPLDEFFQKAEERQQENQYAGRAWSMCELRKKSFDDLHKLWFVMVKERNMLMTEKHILVQLNNRFPNPGRVKKVKLGMNRIKQVLGERERAGEQNAKKQRMQPQIAAERERLRDWICEVMLRAEKPLTANEIAAPLYQHPKRGSVVDKYGGVRAFMRKQMGHFRRSDDSDTATYYLRPAVVRRLTAAPPPSPNSAWGEDFGKNRPAEISQAAAS